MNELKQQRAVLIVEREALENSLPQLESDWQNAPSNYSSTGNMIGSPQRTAAMNRLSNAKGRLRAIPNELESIEQKLTHIERLAQVKQIKAKSTKVMADAANTVAALEQTRAHLIERLQAIQTESEQALEKAQQAELDAASLYARSLVKGDVEGEKAANGEIQKAAQELAVTDERVRQQELILTALQAELDAIETQITTAQRQGNEAREAALGAIGLALDEEWNAAVKHLSIIGAKIQAVSYQRGGVGDGLSKLSVPRFGPGVTSLDSADLADAAGDISLADLLAA